MKHSIGEYVMSIKLFTSSGSISDYSLMCINHPVVFRYIRPCVLTFKTALWLLSVLQ